MNHAFGVGGCGRRRRTSTACVPPVSVVPGVARGLKRRREGGRQERVPPTPSRLSLHRGPGRCGGGSRRLLLLLLLFPPGAEERPLRPGRGGPRGWALSYAATVAGVVSSEPPYNNHHRVSSVLVFAFIYFGAAIFVNVKEQCHGNKTFSSGVLESDRYRIDWTPATLRNH